MCRHLAYIGEPVRVSDIYTAGDHSLVHQSYLPKDMRGGGVINADGYGVAWWSDGEASRYRSASPIWADRSGEAAMSSCRSHAVVAAVRSATVGMPLVETACAPFISRQWAFSHNGYVAQWPHSVVPLAGEIPLADLMTVDAPTDSAVLWAWVRHQLHNGRAASDVLTELTCRIGAEFPSSKLNFLLCDGHTITATTWGHSLSVRSDGATVLVASEPTDSSPQWRAVPDRHLVVATTSLVDVHPLACTPIEEPQI
ncbi:ergothioneine biosynthesis protein EgtC [Hoyosella rhizosphaerae]|uniref:Gamma-glutamyl-hercynylcysteine sulfoxide hydrolase n=1 Tax=Hoyosella rhizosphaerae TaxID=1755582 RepID=A0A916U2A8_9ACTN|nr:ergothioneine biosynthesis protein EgtC [Hoyosella rhizosphaerae]MBN4926776.1 ergothioneine biosynthesis protein EgtC [Hoyosella rhizosphaerae]GGC56563.1 gamma-glutamyl-hercynylcysteine sulfoxide hydrolase [Hoyosella rhizosphaerae]